MRPTGSSRFVGAASLMALLTLVSRLLGLVREYLFSRYFGTSELLSAFRLAFQAPNLARRLFGEGALSSAMVPVLTRTLQERGSLESRRFVGSVFTVLVLVLGALLALVELGLAVWRWVHDDPALRLTAILMPYMVLICCAAVAGGVLNVLRHFAVPAAAPTILNVAMIMAMWGGASLAGLDDAALMDWTCVSVLAAGLIQLLATGWALKRSSFFPLWGGSWRDSQLRQVIWLMAPMTLGLSAVQINTLLDSLIAYLFVMDERGQRVGTAVLGYAQFLYQLPLGVFGISLATALFPVLSARAAEGDRAGMARVFERGVRTGQFIALPSMIGLLFVATPLVATLYEHGGEFDAESTARVAATLSFYSLGIPAYFMQHVLVRVYYALHDSQTPARIAVSMVGLNLAMNLLFVFLMEERGLALSTSISSALQSIWLGRKLSRLGPEISWPMIFKGLTRILLAAALMAVALAAMKALGAWQAWPRAAQLLALLGTGVATYLLAAWMLGLEDVREALHEGRRL